MASETITGPQVVSGNPYRTKSLSATDIATAILSPLASLRLTVFLLVAATLVTWIATLDQTRLDILDVKHKHFQNVLVEVPFQTFFVPRWFPDHQNVQGSFYIPSGIAILVAMLINLTAAHVLRFRLQAKGTRLIVGLIAVAAAAGLTWAVIFNGQNADGFQAEPPISWQRMWMLLKIGVLGIGIAAAYGFATIEPERRTEKIGLAIGAIVSLLILLLTFFMGESAFIGDSAMRILWQLIQASIAATAALAACMLLFKRKAGIVVVHLGIAGLMLNEIYVTATNEEQRMMIREGQTVSTAIDIRETEFVAIDQTDSEVDRIVAVPDSQLRSPDTVSHNDLPFDIKCVDYLPNSRLVRVGPVATNRANQGLGKQWLATRTAGGTGMDSEQAADSAAAYVTLTEKSSDKRLGTWMVSQMAWESGMVDTVTVDGTPWQIGLRFKTAYKPYAVKLKDVRADYYLGTTIPKWFESVIELDDHRNDIKSEQKIWMNNPLRYADETFYQSNYQKERDGTEVTVLQLVRNKGWMIPYVCCMFTVIGLVAQFGSSLLTFLEKRRSKQAAVEERKTELLSEVDGEVMSSSWRPFIPAIVLAGFFGLYVVGEAAKAWTAKVEKDEMRLDLLGRVPITFNGRVQPLDSLARNTLRQLSKRETVVDGDGNKQPAIRWLADTVFESPGFDQYELFRVEDPNVQSALGLPADRHRFRYTLAELQDAESTLNNMLPDPDEVDPDSWTPFQKRLAGLRGHLQKVYAIRLALGDPAQRVRDDDVIDRIGMANTLVNSTRLPLVVPTGDEERPWISLAEARNRRWLSDLAEKYEAETVPQLAAAIGQKEVLEPLREELTRMQIIQRMTSDPAVLELMQKATGEADPKKLARLMSDNWDQFPKSIVGEMEQEVQPLVNSIIESRRSQFEQSLMSQVATAMGDDQKLDVDLPHLAALDSLESAWRSGDATTFNENLQAHFSEVSATPPAGLRPTAVAMEKFFNAFSPFYLAMVVYLAAALVAAIGWIIWPEALRKATVWLLLLGLSVHMSGLVMRIVISGRPPITNLYSSVLFVSAVYVAMMMLVERITRVGIGNAMAGVGGFLALIWAWTMSIVDGDTFAVLVAVLDTQFWLSTHVVCISVGYAATFAAGFVGLAYVVSGLVTSAQNKQRRKDFGNVMYGLICFGLLASFFGTVLGGLWGDDSWGRFWGWDPKENGALMIVLWNAVSLHARWGGMVKNRGFAALAILGNVVTLWSWKGVNAMGVGLHAYAGTEDNTVKMILLVALLHVAICLATLIPIRFWASHAND